MFIYYRQYISKLTFSYSCPFRFLNSEAVSIIHCDRLSVCLSRLAMFETKLLTLKENPLLNAIQTKLKEMYQL